MQVLVFSLICCALWGAASRGIRFVLSLLPRTVLLLGRFVVVYGALMYVHTCLDDGHVLKVVYKTALDGTTGLLFVSPDTSGPYSAAPVSTPAPSSAPADNSVNPPQSSDLDSQ